MNEMIFFDNKARKFAEAYYVDVVKGLSIINSDEDADRILYAISIRPVMYNTNRLALLKLCEYNKEFTTILDFYEYSMECWGVRNCDVLDLFSKINSEELIESFFEILRYIKLKGKDLDGRQITDSVADSMIMSLMDVYRVLLKDIVENGRFGARKRSISKRRSIVRKIIKKASYKIIIERHLKEVFRGVCMPIKVSNEYQEASRKVCGKSARFFLKHVNSKWRKVELYRDLNILLKSRSSRSKFSEDVVLKAMRECLLRGDGIFHMDFIAMSREVEIAHEANKIKNIYDFTTSMVVYKGLKVDVGHINYKLIKIADIPKRFELDRETGFVYFTENQFCKYLEIFDRSEMDLYVYDLSCASGILGVESPVLKINKKICVIPEVISHFTIDKYVDRIISHPDVELRQGGSVNKGLFFENYLVDLFSKCDLDVRKTNRNDKKLVPEIDGVFVIDDYVVVYEAKSSVRIEDRHEAFRFLDNHISKALMQLDKAIDYINRDFVDFKNRTGIDISGKTIVPIIISNVEYFSGCSFSTPKGARVYCVDDGLLFSIFKESKILEWKAGSVHERYEYKSIALKTSHSKIDALKDPSKYMVSAHKSWIQILDHGVSFEVAREYDIS